MGYLFLSVSLLSGAIKGFCGKKLGGYAENTKSAVLLNTFRMLFCVIFGFVFLLLTGDFSQLRPTVGVIAVSALSGIGTAVFVVSWLMAVRKSAYMMLDVFLMLGTLVPMLAGKLFYSENIGIKRFIGFAVLVAAAVIMCSYSSRLKSKLTLSSVLLLILCGFANGVTDFSQKIYVKSFPEMPVSIFNFYTYAISLISLIAAFLIFSKKDKISFNSENSKLSLIYILIMAIALTANSYFKTKAAIYLDSSQLYPINQGAALVLSSLMAALLFKEKLTPKAIFGIVLSFIGLMIINL